MIKILTFLSLIYLSLSLWCTEVKNPNSPEDCFTNVKKLTLYDCCYMSFKVNYYSQEIQEQKICDFVMKGPSLEEFAKNHERLSATENLLNITVLEVKCEGKSYSKEE